METTSKLKIGDLVRLKSGSPLMTVTQLTANRIGVAFFSDEKMCEFLIPEQALKISQ